MTFFIVCVAIAIICTIAGVIAAWLDKRSSHRFSLAILGALFGLIALIANVAYETHVNAETAELLRNRIGILLDIPGEPQKEFIDEYATSAKTIEQFKNPFLSRQRAALENDFRNKYNRIAQGTIDVPKDRLTLMAMDLTSVAKKRILATSVFSIDWNQQWSSEYWQLQKKRIGDGVQVYRIFILNGQSPAECDPVFRQHTNAGVHVSFIDSSELTPDENKDFIVIDNELEAELVFTVKNQVVGGTVTVDPKQVMKDSDLFQNLAVKAHAYK